MDLPSGWPNRLILMLPGCLLDFYVLKAQWIMKGIAETNRNRHINGDWKFSGWRNIG